MRCAEVADDLHARVLAREPLALQHETGALMCGVAVGPCALYTGVTEALAPQPATTIVWCTGQHVVQAVQAVPSFQGTRQQHPT